MYTNINANGHATMKLSNIHMGMRFAKNFQFISCCNLTYAYVMRLSWVSHANCSGKHFNVAILHDVHAILCKFHKILLRLPYVLCSCPAIAIRHPHDQSEYHTTPLDVCFILPICIKRGAPAWIFHMDSADDTKMEFFFIFVFMRTQVYPHYLNLIVINRFIDCTVMCTLLINILSITFPEI